jgi:hypothetical protein
VSIVAHRFVTFLLITSLFLLAVAVWRKDVLPAHQGLSEALLVEPAQVLTQQPPIETTVGGITYKIQPLYTYDLYGMVVSKHDPGTWWDYIHRQWNDKLNVADLCVVWGNNVRSGAYSDISFSSGQFTCNFSTSSSKAFAAFDQTAISNNHLITDDSRLARKVREVRIGDQVHFRGYLAEYSHNHEFAFKRGTSVVRTDTGNGACETVYLEDFEILHHGGEPWHLLVKIAIGFLIASVIAWFVLPVRVND